MKHKYLYLVIFLWFAVMMVLLTSCTKTYEPPTIWTVSIKQSGDTLTAVARNTKSNNLTYRWDINGKRTTGITTLLTKGRNDIQLSVLDDLGGSKAEYYTIVRP